MSASLKTPTTQRAIARTQKRVAASDRKRRAAVEKAAREEAAAELLAPKVQREQILGRDGLPIRGARVQRDGICFRVSSPIQHLVARNRNKDAPLITKRMGDACDRLLMAYQESQTITAGVSSYEQRTGTAQMGFIGEQQLRAVNRQIHAKREVEAVKTHLGPLWGCIYSVVILGIEISAWAEATQTDPKAATGFLSASLERLVWLYAEPQQQSRIRTVAVERREYSAAAE